MSTLTRKKRPTGKTMLLDGKEHPTYGKVTKAELYAALASIEEIVGGDQGEEWDMQNSHRKFRGDKSLMHERLSLVFRIAHGWQPLHSCYDSHERWRSLASPIPPLTAESRGEGEER